MFPAVRLTNEATKQAARTSFISSLSSPAAHAFSPPSLSASKEPRQIKQQRSFTLNGNTVEGFAFFSPLVHGRPAWACLDFESPVFRAYARSCHPNSSSQIGHRIPERRATRKENREGYLELQSRTHVCRLRQCVWLRRLWLHRTGPFQF